MTHEEIKEFLPIEEREKMYEKNPYREYGLLGMRVVEHIKFNSVYVNGWLAGRNYTLHKLLAYMKKGKQIDKSLMREFFAEILNRPDFGNETKKNNI